MEITAEFEIDEGSFGARAAFGAVWVTVPFSDLVLRIAPDTGVIEERILTRPGPRTIAVGEGGVWVAADGGVTHIDPVSNTVVAIAVDSGGIPAGDIAVGEGSVWLRDIEQLVARIDPSTDQVIAWYGPPQGSGSVGAGSGALWVTAHDVGKIYRVPLEA
jgi:hypothetical protein